MPSTTVAPAAPAVTTDGMFPSTDGPAVRPDPATNPDLTAVPDASPDAVATPAANDSAATAKRSSGTASARRKPIMRGDQVVRTGNSPAGRKASTAAITM